MKDELNNNKPQKKIGKLQILFLLLLVVGTVFILSRHRSHVVFYESHGKIFGTYYNIKYEHTERLDSAILERLRMVDNSLSMFNQQSAVAKINRNESTHGDDYLCKVLSLALSISHETEGAFDVTVAPLVNLWGFGFERIDTVSPLMIDSLLEFVGYKKVQLVEKEVLKSDPRVMLDFSSIAKGFGVDVVARFLDSVSVNNYMVEIGGEVVVKGTNSNGNAWTIGVSEPVEDGGEELNTLLHLSSGGLATSGNYRRFYYKNGKRYAHTVDPKTGYPVEHQLLSATVLAKDCATADAYATAFMVMGKDATQKFLEHKENIDAYLIYVDDRGQLNTWSTEGMKRYLHK